MQGARWEFGRAKVKYAFVVFGFYEDCVVCFGEEASTFAEILYFQLSALNLVRAFNSAYGLP